MIDTSTWKEFRVGDLFDIHPTKAYKLTNAQLLDGGDYPVIANSAYNNGIGGYSTKKPTEKSNMVTFSDTVDANTIFYQPNDFVGYPHVQGLYPLMYADKWNEYTYSFFVSVFRGSAISKGFDYGNKFRRDIAVDLIIKLPATSDGQPDWDYMESYMKAVIEESKKSLENLKKADGTKHLIDTSTWKEFNMSDIGFTNYHGIRQTKADRKDGNIPLLTAGKENQGVASYISNAPSVYIDAITVDMFGNSFFHKGNYAGDDNVYFFINDNISDDAKLFIAALLNTNNSKIYTYKEQFRQPQANTLSIYLPATSTGEPDWPYIENYMKNIMNKSEQIISNLQIGA